MTSLPSKKLSLFVRGMLVFNFLVLSLTFVDFLALHDISKDYLSRETLKNLSISVSLPAWTATEAEWQIITISFLARIIFFILNIFLLWYLLKKKRALRNTKTGFIGEIR